MKAQWNIVPRILGLLILLTASHIALGSLITTPDDLAPGDQYRLVFVTAELHDASSAQIEEYNLFVASQAAGSASLAALNTTWRVLGSTPAMDAITNTDTDPSLAGVPVYNLNSQLVATGYGDLWDGSLGNAINVDQNGNTLNGAVFTGTGTNGLGLSDRQFGANGFRVQYGNSGLVTSGWTTIDWSGSLTSLHFYGISDILQVPAVPEPASLLMLALGGISLTRIRQKKNRCN